MRLLEEIEIRDVILSADPGFLYPVENIRPVGDKPKIGISLRQWVDKSVEEKIVISFKDFLDMVPEKYDFYFLSFQDHDEGNTDSSIFQRIRSEIKRPESLTLIRSKDYSLEDLEKTIAGLNFLVGMRLHSIILALKYGIPFFAIPYWNKVEHLLTETGLDDLSVCIKDVSGEKIRDKFTSLFSQPSEIKTRIGKGISIIEQRLRHGTDTMKDFLTDMSEIRSMPSPVEQPEGKSPLPTEWVSYKIHQERLKKQFYEKRYSNFMIERILKRTHYKKIVFYPSPIHWEIPLFQRPHQIFKELSKRGYLVFFLTPNPVEDRAEPIREINENLYLIKDIDMLHCLKDEPIILWITWTPNIVCKELFPKSIVVYDWIDELDVFSFYSKFMEIDHRKLLYSADIVLATSDSLLKEAKDLRADALLVPNGVFIGDFKVEGNSVPEDIAGILSDGKPIIGYYGLLADWRMDYDLVNYLCRECKDLNFVFIGPSYDGSSKKLKSAPNLFLLGPKKYEELRYYLKRFDVAIIPYKVDRITNSVFPVKLCEYMAGGKPVVTSNMKECKKFKSVLVSESYDDFISNIRKALLFKADREYRKILTEEANSNRWEDRVDKIITVLESGGFPKRQEREGVEERLIIAEEEVQAMQNLLNHSFYATDVLQLKLNQTIAEKDNLWNQLNQTIAQKDKTWNQLNQTIAEKDNIWSQLNQAVDEKGALSTQLTQITSERNNIWNKLNQTIVEKDDLGNQLNQAIAGRIVVNNQLTQVVAEKSNIWNKLNETITEKDGLLNQLNGIYSSDFWKAASIYYGVRNRLFKYPFKFFQAWRREGLKSCIKKIKIELPRISNSAVETPQIEKTGEGQYSPYEHLKLLKEIEVSVIETEFDERGIFTPFSLVTTMKNEGSNVIDFLKSIECQHLKPNEVVLVDGGSTDDTIELVDQYKGNSTLNIKFVKGSNLNIAQGRNRGMENAGNEILVLTDAGCKLDKNFCKNLVGCLNADGQIDLVGGIYYPSKQSEFSAYYIGDWNKVVWKEFLPSARAVAVKRTMALEVGGFPEYVTLTGEDTLFDINYRKISTKWAFNKKASVSWDAPNDQEAALNLAYSYGRGDGESGAGDIRFHGIFYRQVKLYKFGQVDIDHPINRALFLGYMEGRKRRSDIEIKKRRIKGAVLILSEFPFVESGAIDSKMALEFVAKGYKVIFVSVSQKPSENREIWFDIDYTLIELYTAHDFDWGEFIERYYAKIPDRTFVLYRIYHPILGGLIEKLKAKTGNKIQVVSETDEIPEDNSNKAIPEFKTDIEANLGGSTLAVGDEIPPQNLSFADYQDKKNSLALNFAKIYNYTKKYGVQETARKSFRKLKRELIKTKQEATGNIALQSTPSLAVAQTSGGYCYDIMSFPIMPWFSRFQRSQQLVTQFATNGARIFRIDRGFLLEDQKKYLLERVQENILHVTLNSSRNLSIYTDYIDEDSLKRMLKSIEDLRIDYMISNAFCIVELPFWYPLARELKERYGWKIVYDCMDEHEGFSTNESNMLSTEAKLAEEASLVVVTSNDLYNKMKKNNDNCVLVPNAADFVHFRHLPANDLLKDVKKPVIGYYGAISEWFDLEMVRYAANARKDWNFILIGGNDNNSGFGGLEKLPNVHFLGEKPYSELPKYLYWYDVCIIPFRLNKVTQATNPVKFYEFISSGKPVVSVRLPELVRYSDILYLADSNEDFVKKIAAALEENDDEMRRKRIELARENTWDKRYQTLRTALNRIYPMVSIIVVSYNNLDLTKACIESIYRYSQYPNFEVIIIDNASHGDTPRYLSEISENHANMRIIFNENNMGFASANNQGIKIANGDYIILLNNDTIVTPGWVSRLLRHLEDKRVGMIGPVTNMCGNEAIIYVSYNLNTLEGFDDYVRFFFKSHPVPDSFEIDMLSMFCVALRKEVIEEIGLLDERFKVGLFEDTDYSQRLKVKNYKLICARMSSSIIIAGLRSASCPTKNT